MTNQSFGGNVLQVQRENRWLVNKKPPSSKGKKSSILWKCSTIKLQSVCVHYEPYRTCPDRLHWCQVLSASSGVILSGGNNHAVVAFAPFLLILLKSGPTDDETFLPFSLCLSENASSFSKNIKKPMSAHLRFLAFFVRLRRWSQTAEMKTKGTKNCFHQRPPPT